MQTQIRLLLKKQSDQGIPCLIFLQAFCECRQTTLFRILEHLMQPNKCYMPITFFKILFIIISFNNSVDPDQLELNSNSQNESILIEPQHEISNNVVCGTSIGSDQPAHTGSLIRAFASCLDIL